MGVLTAINSFPSTLSVYGSISSYNSYVGEKIYFGSGTTPDVNLYRNAANILKTDDSFVVSGSLSVLANTTINGNTTLGDANTDTTVVNGGLSAISISQTVSSHSIFTGTTIDVNLNNAIYQIIPVALTNSVINFGGFAPGRTNFVLLSSIATTNLTIDPQPRNLIYMDGRPTTLPNTKVMLFEIKTFGASVSSIIVTTKTWP
jgi:hypothetical protein